MKSMALPNDAGRLWRVRRALSRGHARGSLGGWDKVSVFLTFRG